MIRTDEEKSKISTSAEDLSSMGITRIGVNGDFLLLKCEGCGSFYDVPLDNDYRINWYSCPDKRHKHHLFSVRRG